MAPEDPFHLSAEIYVALRGEGTDVWRPVKAHHISGDLYRIIGTVPDDEEWEYQPGDLVRCRWREFANGSGLLAVERMTPTA